MEKFFFLIFIISCIYRGRQSTGVENAVSPWLTAKLRNGMFKPKKPKRFLISYTIYRAIPLK